MNYVGFIDGSAIPNPGQGGAGCVIFKIVNKDGEKMGIKICEGCYYLGENVTNNQAEYAAMVFCLDLAQSMGIEEIEIVTDSQHLYKAITGEYKVNDPHLRDKLGMIREYMRLFDYVEVNHSKKEVGATEEAHEFAQAAILLKKSSVKKIERV